MTVVSGEQWPMWPGQGNWNRRTAWTGQMGQDRTSWTVHLGPDNWDRTAETGWTGQVSLKVTGTGQPGHDNVWKMNLSRKFQFFRKYFRKRIFFIFAEMFAKTDIFVTFSRKCLFWNANVFAKILDCCETKMFVKRNFAKISLS
jgi:hypothetical protein